MRIGLEGVTGLPLIRVRFAPRSFSAAVVLTICAALLLAVATPASAVTRKGAAKKAHAARVAVKHAGAKAKRSKLNRRARANRARKHRGWQAKATGKPSPTASAAFSGDLFAAAPLASGNNSKPNADGQHLTVKQNSPKRITLHATDADEDPLIYTITKDPKHGTLSGQPPDVTYTPDVDYLGPDQFQFEASDEVESNAANVQLTVVPPGLPPTVTTSAGCTTYTEQGPAVVVDSLVLVADPDDVVLDHATVRIATGFQDGDNLLFTDQNGITSFYDEFNGVLHLSGESSVLNYQTALRSVSYRNVADGDSTGNKDIEFIVNDAANDSLPATKQICVTGGEGGGNNPPVGEPGEGGLSYIENDGPVPVDSGIVVGDPDSTTLSGATIKFVPFVTQPVDENGDPVGPPISTVTFAPDEDELAFVDQNGITGSYNDTTGEMTLSGTASVADYETAMRSVTYENNSEDPSDATRRLQFQVTDSTALNSIARRRDVFITPVNDAPVVTTTEGTTDYTGEATPIDAGVTTLDVDDDDLESAVVRISDGFASGDDLVFVDQLGIAGVYDTETGVLTLTGTAPVADYETALQSVAFDHTGDTPTGDRTVEFMVNDGDLDSGPATKHVEINDKPVLDATDDALAYTENDGPVVVDGAITATDPDSPQLAGATVTISANFVEAEDELAFTDQNGITGSYDDPTGVLTLSGSASVSDYETALRSVTYENSSEAPSTATRTVTFQADDGAVFNNLSDAVSRDITVTSVNDLPVVTASDGVTAYTEGDPATVVDAGLTVADIDDTDLESAQVRISSGFEAGDELLFTDQLNISGVYNPETGDLTLTGTAPVADYETALRTVEYRHTGDNPAASKTVEFKVNDGDDSSSPATKDLAITGVNDKPVLDTTDTALTYSVGSGAVAVDSGITATDPDSAQLAGATVAITTGFIEAEDELGFTDQNGITGVYNDTTGELALSGAASVSDYQAALRSVTYTNALAEPTFATRTVTFQADDGGATDNLSDPVTRDINLSNNDAPVVTTSAGTTSYTIGDPAVTIDGAVTVTDGDDTDLESAQVRIATGFETGDNITFVDQLGISGVYNTGTGVLNMTGTAPVSDYETALRSITYDYTGENPSGSRIVEFTVNDGDVDSNAATKPLDIFPPPEE